MKKVAGILTKIEEIEEIVLNLEKQGLLIDHELQNDRDEISRLRALELQQHY
jgi:hypothetical protein